MYEDKDYFKPTHFIWYSVIDISIVGPRESGMGNARYVRRSPPAHAGSEISLINGIGGNFLLRLISNNVAIIQKVKRDLVSN